LEELQGLQVLFQVVPDEVEKKEAALFARLGVKSEPPEFVEGKLLRLP